MENGDYYVIVTDQNGCTNISGTETVSTIVGVENALNMIRLYPNPTNGLATLKSINTLDIHRIVVTDLTGKILFNQRVESVSGDIFIIDLTNQSSGIYLVDLISVKETYHVKLIKQ